MATKSEHRARAEHNENLVAILQYPFWDWKVTGLFYAAVHYVQCYFAAKSVTLPPGKMNHRKRLTLVQWHLRSIYKDYEDLYNDCREARYEADIEFTEKEVKVLENKLESVKKEILPHL
ncbi:MAG: hypothetical protein ACRD2U_01130 [Terriglobales bacterium]